MRTKKKTGDACIIPGRGYLTMHLPEPETQSIELTVINDFVEAIKVETYTNQLNKYVVLIRPKEGR